MLTLVGAGVEEPVMSSEVSSTESPARDEPLPFAPAADLRQNQPRAAVEQVAFRRQVDVDQFGIDMQVRLPSLLSDPPCPPLPLSSPFSHDFSFLSPF